MINTTSIFSRTVAITCSILLVNLAVPMTAGYWIGKNLPDNLPKPNAAPAPSQMLSAKQMLTYSGKTDKNPYTAGSNKWAASYKGVDLLTGNFTTSATDLSFEGGYGIPVNVTRSYSSNAFDEGPLGPGWSLSVDVRSTAGILAALGATVERRPGADRTVDYRVVSPGAGQQS